MKFLPSLLLLLFLVASCTYTIKIRDGETAFDRKQYKVATDFYKKEFDKADRRSEKGKIAYQIGLSYNKIGEPDKALQWFKTSYDNGFGVDALKAYAYTLKENERYQEALETFEQLGFEIGSPYEYRKEVTACKVAIDWKKNISKNIEINQTEINTNSNDFGPVLFKENMLLISSDRNAATGDEQYPWTGKGYMDIFEADPQSGMVNPVFPFLNTEENEASIALNSDNTEVFFTRCSGDIDNVSYCKIFTSRFHDNEWSLPVELEFQLPEINYIHPYLGHQDNILYFACNDPQGWGGYDIYFSERTPGGWEAPKLMSRSINTEEDEAFPVVDNDTIYFASKGHTGMGGFDVFRSYKITTGSWSPPYNMLPPVNSGFDDFGFVLDRRNSLPENVLEIGYFSSNRLGGKGGDDIYLYKKNVPVEPPVVEEEKPEEYHMYLDGYVIEKIFEKAEDPNSRVLGRKPLNNSKVIVEYNGQKKEYTSGEDGLFSFELEENTDYRFFASKDGYLNEEGRFSTKGIAKDPNRPEQRFEIELELDKIYLNKEITLENIYYDFDKWDIREDAKPTLNDLVRTMQLNPDMTIQLASHTDCRGSDRYNLDLSQKRAQSAVDYLIQNGIQSDRLVARGFGESSPAVGCNCTRCTEDEHQANRRTTFTILDDNTLD
jgi:outer membrane protein OmpA-like peptidoglycan-associated protein/tetratricopeptide (TPR) repeat protein